MAVNYFFIVMIAGSNKKKLEKKDRAEEVGWVNLSEELPKEDFINLQRDC